MKKKVRILSLDGGGMRGIIPATVLEYVERQLQILTKNEDTRLADHFDMVVGTSTGGLLGCFYLTPNPNKGGPTTKYAAPEATAFYTKEGHGIFNDSKKSWYGLRRFTNATKYDPTYLEGLLKGQFGELTMKELLRPCVVTTYDITARSSFFFSSCDNKDKRDFYLRDVMRSTSAAPTYFPPAKVKNLATGKFMMNVDGGVFANNPAMCAYAEARNLKFTHRLPEFPPADDMLILSIGTGGGQFEMNDPKTSHKWSILNWAIVAPEIMMDGALDTVDYQMLRMFSTLGVEGCKNYKRVTVPFHARKYEPDMADASPSNIKKLQEAGLATVEHAQKPRADEHTLDEFIKLLVD